MNVYVLLMMGGSGTRFGLDIPKQFTMVGDRPLFSYIAKKLSIQSNVKGIVVVVNPLWYDFTIDWIERLQISNIVSVIKGGNTRSASVFNGLKALVGLADDTDPILMHDATHPYVDEEGMQMVIQMIDKFGSATLASMNYDTTYLMDDDNNIVKVIPRRNVIAGASPEGFRYKQIYDIYNNSSEEEMESMTSVGAIALKNNIPMKVIPTNILNLKITYQEDMDLFVKLYDSYFFKE